MRRWLSGGGDGEGAEAGGVARGGLFHCGPLRIDLCARGMELRPAGDRFTAEATGDTHPSPLALWQTVLKPAQHTKLAVGGREMTSDD